MPDETDRLSRIISLLTVCRKAGRLVLGFDAVTEAAGKHRAACILLAADCAARTEKEIRFRCRDSAIRKLPADMEQLGMYFRKRTAVFGVCDPGFAGRLLTLLPEEQPCSECQVSAGSPAEDAGNAASQPQ